MLGALALLVTLGVLTVAAMGIAYYVGERRPFVIATLTVALLILGLAGFGRLTQSLLSATGLLLLSGAVIVGLTLRASPPYAVPAWTRPKFGGWADGATVAIFLLGTFCAFQGYWWDEYSCHYPLTAAAARGILPLQHPLFPGEAFRYHYAFDLLAGWIRALTGLNVATALDLVSVGALALLLGTCRDLGQTLGGPKLARWMPVLVTLGSGTLFFLLYTDNGSIEVHWDLLPVRWRNSVPPPTISNFFQHPQGLGMPMALGVLMLFDRPLGDLLHLRRSLVAVLVMAALSLSQIVFFGTLGLTIGLSVLVLGIKERQPKAVITDGLLLLGSLGAAVALGGFFAPGQPAESMLVFGKSVFTDPPLMQVAYHLVVFGIPLLALPWALQHTLRNPSPLRLPMAIAAVFGFMVPHFVTYERSWDIVKFFAVGGFFANVLLAETLSRAKGWAKHRAFVATIFVAATFSSWVFLFRMGVFDGRLGIPPMHFPPPSEVGRVVGERLYELAERDEYVFSTNVELARAAGILTPGFDWRQVGQGFMLDQDRSIELSRHKTRARRNLDPKALEALKVSWLVLSDQEKGWLDPRGRARLADAQRFELIDTIRVKNDVRHIYRILPGAFTP